jgi:hypothetical protein
MDAAELNNEAAEARLETAKLQAQIAQTSANVAKVDPLNQPTSGISASVVIRVNRTYSNDLPIRSIWPGRIAEMELCNAGMKSPGWRFFLYADSYRRISGRSKLGVNAKEVEKYTYFIHFDWLDIDKESYQLIGGQPFTTASLYDYVKILKFDADFIPRDADVLGGSAELAIMGSGGFVQKRFEIAPQKPLKREGAGMNPSSSGYTIIAANPD